MGWISIAGLTINDQLRTGTDAKAVTVQTSHLQALAFYTTDRRNESAPANKAVV